MHRAPPPWPAARRCALLAVPILWGSYAPATKLLLGAGGAAPPLLFVALATHCVGAASLAALWAAQAACAPAAGISGKREAWPPAQRRRLVVGSLELGTYLFFGQLLQLVGLRWTTATLNAILVQSSVVLVPFLEPLLSETSDAATGNGDRDRPSPWRRFGPSALALCGIVLVTLFDAAGDATGGAAGGTAAGPRADARRGIAVVASLAAALCYAVHTMRLGAYSDVDAAAQAAGQVAANAALDLFALVAWRAVHVFLDFGAADTAFSAAAWLASPRVLIGVLWNGVFVVGATTWAMSFAQQAVPPATAALAYALEPFFAAVFAAAALGDALAPQQLIGGACVVAANAAAAGAFDSCSHRRAEKAAPPRDASDDDGDAHDDDSFEHADAPLVHARPRP